MNNAHRKINIPLYVGIAFLACLILIEFVSIMMLNSGLLVYTLDDPYIHLALAENIKQGHYGINISEFSAPSSSPLWPFILAPFSSYPYSAFYINAVSAIASVIVLVKILNFIKLGLLKCLVKFKRPHKKKLRRFIQEVRMVSLNYIPIG